MLLCYYCIYVIIAWARESFHQDFNIPHVLSDITQKDCKCFTQGEEELCLSQRASAPSLWHEAGVAMSPECVCLSLTPSTAAS